MNNTKMLQTSRSRTLHSVLDRFAEETTIHGVSPIIRRHTFLEKVFWTTMFIAACMALCTQSYQLLINYYSYPVKVNTEIDSHAFEFPTISICNMRHLNYSVVNEINLIFKQHSEQDANLHWAEDSNNTFIKAYMNLMAKYFIQYNTYHDQDTPYTVTSRAFLATKFSAKLLQESGVQLEELIVDCTFRGKPCQDVMTVSRFFDPYFFNCYKYEPRILDFHQKRFREGMESGWTAVIYFGNLMLDNNEDFLFIPGLTDTSSPLFANEGIRVVIHPPNTDPYPMIEGYDVSPSVAVSISLHERKNIRLGMPYGHCTSDLDRQKKYRMLECQAKTYQKEVVNLCGCKDISLPDGERYPSVPFCDEDIVDDGCIHNNSTLQAEVCNPQVQAIMRRQACSRSAYFQLNSSMTHAADLDSLCFSPCEDTMYDITYSFSRWPADNIFGDQANALLAHYDKNAARKEWKESWGTGDDAYTKRWLNSDFAKVTVYVGDSNVVITRETPGYPLNQLLSDLGGQLGLWVGISVISLVELVEFLSKLLRAAHWKRGHSRVIMGSAEENVPF